MELYKAVPSHYWHLLKQELWVQEHPQTAYQSWRATPSKVKDEIFSGLGGLDKHRLSILVRLSQRQFLLIHLAQPPTWDWTSSVSLEWPGLKRYNWASYANQWDSTWTWNSSSSFMEMLKRREDRENRTLQHHTHTGETWRVIFSPLPTITGTGLGKRKITIVKWCVQS